MKDKGKAPAVIDVLSTNSTPSPQINSMCSVPNVYALTNAFAALGVERKNQHSWILNCGATDHVASSLSWFTSYSHVKDLYSHLLDYIIVQVTHTGTV